MLDKSLNTYIDIKGVKSVFEKRFATRAGYTDRKAS